MKSSELRIGNYFKHSLFEDYLEIQSISESGLCSAKEVNGGFEIEHTNPIPLTDEWLLKFGFEFHTNANCQNFYYAKDAFICIRADEDFEWFRYYNGDFYHELKYVHQLQNLYFALTGEELTLKP
jgi:hypothetical protein